MTRIQYVVYRISLSPRRAASSRGNPAVRGDVSSSDDLGRFEEDETLAKVQLRSVTHTRTRTRRTMPSTAPPTARRR
tara:strand:- start:27 stop:257 length:231 start_codon:yes stop_codon:yes gene_type:complete